MVGAVALAGCRVRFPADGLAPVVFGAWFVTLVVGLATDLDQRLLPDELTLPVIPVALVYALIGLNPLVGHGVRPGHPGRGDRPGRAVSPSLPFGAGAFGLGDVKLLVGMGLLLGGERALGGTLVGLLAGGGRPRRAAGGARIGRRSYVPFGPFLILGALWAVLVLA